jgi:putative cell wall-binding protein
MKGGGLMRRYLSRRTFTVLVIFTTVLALFNTNMAVKAAGTNLDISFSIISPTSNSGQSSDVKIVISNPVSTYQISEVTATVDEKETNLTYNQNAYTNNGVNNPGWTGQLNLDGLTPGVKTLTVTVTDGYGSSASNQTSFTYALPPNLTVDSPQDAQFSNGQLQIKAEASDPAGENCTIKVYEAFANYDTGTLLTQSVNNIDTIVDLNKYNGQQIVLRFEATNDSGVTTTVYRNVTVDNSSLLNKQVQVDGQILDYKDNKLLYKTNNNELKIRDLSTSVDTSIYSDSVNTPDMGYLTPYGALFLVKRDTNYDTLFEYKNNKLTNLGKVDNQMKPFKVNGQYAIWNQDSMLYLINLDNDQITLVSNNAALRLNDVAPNGDVFYMANSKIYKYSNGTTSQVSLDNSQFNGYPLSNGKVTLYERYKPVYYSLPTISLILNVNGQEQVLSTYNVEFLPGVLYAIAGDYVAYTKTVNGIRQIFLWKDGVTKQLTYLNSDTVIASLNENGDVVASVSKAPASDNYLVKSDGSPPIKLDSASLKYYWTDSGLYGSVGDSFFSIMPNQAAVTGITLSDSQLDLIIGDQQNIKANVLPYDAANKNISWTSSNPDIAAVDSTGKVTALKVGTAIITATTVDGNKSATCTVTVKDVTPPAAPSVNPVNDSDNVITGSAEPGTTVTVTAGGEVLGTTVTDSNGNFTLAITVQKAGTSLTVTATDTAGNVSDVTEVTVDDVTAPSIPSVDDVTDKSSSVTGTAEPGATITVENGTNAIGNAIVNGDGTFSVPIDLQKAGTKLTVTATDAAGNISDANEVTVKDVTAPGIPTVNDIADNSTSVTGTAEPGATITVTAGTNLLGTTVVNDDGTYSVPIDMQKAGTKLAITVKDNAGNISEAAEVTVKDGTPPNIPQVSDITDKSTSVTGTAEAGATITVKSGTRVIGTVDVNGDGTFTAPISLQQAGTILTVTATDAAGNVSGEATVTVIDKPRTVERISGATRMDTAVEIAKKGWQSANTVVIATGYDFPDALAGSPLAYKLNAPILLTNSNGLSDSTKQEISDLKSTNAVILGGMSAVSSDVEQQLKSLGITNIERLAGSNRFETASMIAAKIGGNPSTAILADGYNYPDALSIASYAAQNGYPILLTRTDALPSETNNQLAGKTKTIVVGGEAAVSNNVLNSVSGAERISGATRFETGANLITQLQLSTDKVFIATGRNFADALTGSVLAAKEKAPMLLVEQNFIPDPINNLFVSKGIASVDILGGNTAVSDSVENNLKN